MNSVSGDSISKSLKFTAKDLLGDVSSGLNLSLDSVLPKSPLLNDFVDNQLVKFNGFDKTLNKMGEDLGINSSNTILTESNEEFDIDDDIIISRINEGNDDD